MAERVLKLRFDRMTTHSTVIDWPIDEVEYAAYLADMDPPDPDTKDIIWGYITDHRDYDDNLKTHLADAEWHEAWTEDATYLVEVALFVPPTKGESNG